ncbi:tetratricopeptide repeat protein [Methanococcus maripaludis]|uniref:Tetratricopeptide (TPR) repeat protein n=1 Tax=Methanococcus maripaludis TaxID=39152 RepID=A0A7J9S4G9_METMI|nr:tetratricopeptide repeat protein [Methanococcus maripaludis]MBB6067562.1 tetratricopeptide (TPR) repeat protein [Methanococcus maripaludis]
MSDFDDLVKEGDEFFKKEEYGEAIKVYTLVLNNDPYDPEIHVKMGDCYFELENYKKAILFYNRHVELNPPCHPEIYDKLGCAYLYINNYDNALECYKKSLIINPNFEKGHVHLCTLYYRKGDYEKAKEHIDEAIKLNPNEPEYYFKKAEHLYYYEDYDEEGYNPEVIDCYNEAIKLNPKNPKYYFRKGEAFYDIERIDEALECYNKAIDLNPEYLEAHFAKGFLLYYDLEEKEEEALEEFYKSNGYASAYRMIGNIYYYLKDYDRAFKFYERYLEESDEWLSIFSKFIRSGKLNDIFKITSKYPENPYAKYIEGKTYLMNNNLGKAINSFISALNLKPNGKLGYPADADEYFTISKYICGSGDLDDSLLENILKNAFPLFKGCHKFQKN